MDVEAELARLRAEGKLNEVATLAIESYGPDVLGFLAAILRDQADAGDAFAQACENLWRGLPRFEARSAVKTWFYTLARNAALRLRGASANHPHVPLSMVSELVEQVRSRTALHLRSQVKSKLTEIRDELDEADRVLLVLRVDRGMSWNDIARVIGASEGGAEDDASDDELAKAAARLRQRFQTIKKTIRERAQESGLLDEWLETDG
jgi:RNA polymerase sigma-70 factor (ECF subfamily)